MIIYDSNNLSYVWRKEGSTIPKAVVFTFPSLVLTALVHLALRHFHDDFRFLEEIDTTFGWSALAVVTGLLLGVRVNAAYGRFWEGINLAQQIRAEWFNTASSLMAFSMVASKKDAAMASNVNRFQFTLVRLMSLMHGAALRQISGNVEEFEVLDVHSLDNESLRYLNQCRESDINRVEVLLHWIQVLITDSAHDGVICVDPPLLTRAYQTLSRGMVHLHNARKLADVPYPFPLAQMMGVLLIIQSVFTPIFSASQVEHIALSILLCFVPIFGMWSLTFVAGELDHPYGTDPNDLPLSVIQYEFNLALMMLLDTQLQYAPSLKQKGSENVKTLRAKLGRRENMSGTDFLVTLHSSSDLDTGTSSNLSTMMGHRTSTASFRSREYGNHERLLQKRQERMRSSAQGVLLHSKTAKSDGSFASPLYESVTSSSTLDDPHDTGALRKIPEASQETRVGASLSMRDNAKERLTSAREPLEMYVENVITKRETNWRRSVHGKSDSLIVAATNNELVETATQALQALMAALPRLASRENRSQVIIPTRSSHQQPSRSLMHREDVPQSSRMVVPVSPVAKAPKVVSPMDTPREFEVDPMHASITNS